MAPQRTRVIFAHLLRGVFMRHGKLALCLSVLVLYVGVADAALTKDQQKCQGTVAKKGRVFFKKRFGALAKCQDAINAGKFAVGTDCALETKTQAKLDKAEQKYRDKIADLCPSAIVATLDFGGQCFGVTTSTDLADCSVEEHETATDALIATVYDDDTRVCDSGPSVGITCSVNADCPACPVMAPCPAPKCVLGRTVGTCDGGPNDTLSCREAADCPTGACELSGEQNFCLKTLGKAIGKLGSKRQSILQKCKKDVAKDKLPLSTDCVAASQAKLDAEFTKALDSISGACTDVITNTLQLAGACERQTLDTVGATACTTCSVTRAADQLVLAQHGSSARGGSATLTQVANLSECVGGRQSRCAVGDYKLANDRIRVIVQAPQRNLFSIGQFGGQIIDGDIIRTFPDPDRDSFEEWALSLNIEGTAHYTALTILNDGSNGGPAILRATGVDDLLDFINPSSTIASFNFLLAPTADDIDLPVTITTDYILEPGTNYVRVETNVQNLGGTQLDIYFGEYINGSGTLEMFQSGYGFGEPLVSARCPLSKPNLCNFTAYSGYGEGDGVSYGYVQQTPGSTSAFTTSGVHVPQLNVEVLLALIGAAPPPFHIQPAANPGDILTVTRYFVVGDGSVSDISDARNEIQCVPSGTVQGNVTAGGNPAVRADISVLGQLADGPGLAAMTRNVITHTRTDDLGNYSFTLPRGAYNVVANLDGAPYEASLLAPTQHPINVAAFGTLTQNIALPATGAVEVTAVDENNAAIPAKVSVVGFDPSPDPLNTQSIFGLVNNRTGVFGDRTKDGVPQGLSRTIYLDTTGDSGVVELEPGSYQIAVSRGPEYSLFTQNVTVTAGSTQTVNAQVERVVDTTGLIAADFHVHSIDSPDSQIANPTRVLTMLDEGMDFFTPTDHDYRFDYQPVIDALGATNLLGTAVGEEITSFDYGHFNAWPLITTPGQVNNGGVDFGGAAPAGQDFPSSNNYNETPASIIALAHADAVGASNTVQINHVHSHFGLDGGSGLGIDTGVVPPTSVVPAAARRLDPAVTNYFTDTFDGLEVWIGDDRAQVLTNFFGQNAGDWFNLMNQGIVRTGIGNSDTHSTVTGVAGFPRNMIASPSDDGGDLSGLANTISDNVNAGRTFATNGPMVRVTAHASSTNESGSIDFGRCTDGVTPCTNVTDCPPCTDDAQCSGGFTCEELPLTIATNDGAVDITVDIQSAEWVEFDEVEFYVNTTTTRTMSNKQTGAGVVSIKRYSITPDYSIAPTQSVVMAPGTSSNRREGRATLSLTGLLEDVWVVAMVKGNDGVSRPLFPVLPTSLSNAGGINDTLAEVTDGNLGEQGITALAFTNPVFVNVDGGAWTAPG
ncbi:MAG: hypothetical protein ACRDUX_02420, partial [Mycobacterium sp.]